MDLDEARTEMLAMGFDEDTVARYILFLECILLLECVLLLLAMGFDEDTLPGI